MTPSQIFIKHNVFLAHCFSFAKMAGTQDTEALGSLGKLDRILNDNVSPNIEVSCSTIRLSDTFLDNYFTGQFGLILKPNKFSSITHISNGDGGTKPSGDGRTRIGTNRVNSVQALEDAIVNRGSEDDPSIKYNEICVNDYKILGLFVTQRENLKSLPERLIDRIQILQFKCDGSELQDLREGRPVSSEDLYISEA